MAYRVGGGEWRCEVCHALCGPRETCEDCGSRGGRDRNPELQASRRACALRGGGYAPLRVVDPRGPEYGPPTPVSLLMRPGPLRESALRWERRHYGAAVEEGAA